MPLIARRYTKSFGNLATCESFSEFFCAHVKSRIFVFLSVTHPLPHLVMSKRARTQTVTTTRKSKRPIDKKLVCINMANLLETQLSTALYPAANFPGTITGLRWEISATRITGTGAEGNPSPIRWAIVVVPQLQSASPMGTGNSSSFYDPEQNVLAFGVGQTNVSTVNSLIWTGSTKSMRKLKSGDQLIFIALGEAVNANSIVGTVQLFYKT